MNKQNYAVENLQRTTYLTCEAGVRRQFEDWIAGMTMDPDGEWGQDRQVDGETVPGFLTWIKEHNATFSPDSLFQTFIWQERLSVSEPGSASGGTIVATATIAPDDRGVKKQYNLGGDGLWGGVNVRVGYRGMGIGKFICASIDQRISNQAQKDGPLQFHLFTANPVAEAIYEGLGFRPNPLGEIHTDAFGGERLYTKKYTDLLDW